MQPNGAYQSWRMSLWNLHVFVFIKCSIFDNLLGQDKLLIRSVSVAHRRYAKSFIAMLQSSCGPDH